MLIDRRTLLLGGSAALGLTACSPAPKSTKSAAKPNILMIIVDEMRSPMWFPAQDQLDALLPALSRIRKSAVSFERHYTAANVCTAARGALITGLYSHQTGCQLVGQSTLSPKFPNWGSMLREHGYQSYWYGKWHLGHASDADPAALAAYGFAGGTFPSPDGNPGDGLAHDGQITDQFVVWFHDNADNGPWCTTVSLVNPHDIMFWPKWLPPEQPPAKFAGVPKNWETPDQLRERRKPKAQLALLELMQTMGGEMPYSGGGLDQRWGEYLSLYLWLQQQADAQIGRVLDALASRPDVDANTVVLFTADHGEYAGSHGLRMKGSGLYEECIRVPFYLRDPRKTLTPDPGGSRDQLTSSVDVAPLMLTIATGGDSWRSEGRYQHLAHRADLAKICRDPRAPGRPWIAHTTDEIFGPHWADAPSHIVGVRTLEAKAGLYASWRPGTTEIDAAAEQDREFYDYSTEPGRLEISSQTGQDPKEQQFHDLLAAKVLPQEVNEPLPGYLKAAQEEGMADLMASTAQESRLY